MKKEELIKIKRNIPFEQSSQIALNPITAYALLSLSKCKKGDFLLLSAGRSAISGLLIQLANHKGIHVICLVRNEPGMERLLELGANSVVNQTKENWAAQVTEYTENVNITAFLDAVGGPLLGSAIKLMRSNGTIILYGRYDLGFAELYNADVIYKNLTIKGFGIGGWLGTLSSIVRNGVFDKLVDDIADSILQLPEIQTFKLGDIKEALFADAHKKGGKVVLVN